MRREALLAAGVVAVGATLLAVATLAPGALADDERGGDPAGELSFEELAVEPDRRGLVARGGTV